MQFLLKMMESIFITVLLIRTPYEVKVYDKPVLNTLPDLNKKVMYSILIILKQIYQLTLQMKYSNFMSLDLHLDLWALKLQIQIIIYLVDHLLIMKKI